MPSTELQARVAGSEDVELCNGENAVSFTNHRQQVQRRNRQKSVSFTNISTGRLPSSRGVLIQEIFQANFHFSSLVKLYHELDETSHRDHKLNV